MEKDITIIIPYWDTPYEQFSVNLKSVCALKIPVIIVDDLSSPAGKQVLHKVIEEEDKLNLVTVITSDVKLQQMGATYKALQVVKTKYCIRVDSDDIINCLPTTTKTDFDIILSQPKMNKNIDEWLAGQKANFNGSIVKTELYLLMYNSWQFQIDIYNYVHEDTFAAIYLFLQRNDLKIYIGDNTIDNICYKTVMSREHKKKLTINKKYKRLDTLLLACTYLKLDPKIYYNYSVQLIDTIKIKNKRK